MTTFKNNAFSILVFIICLLFGIWTTYQNYYPSEFLYIYWVFCAILLGLAVKSKIYLQFSFTKQNIALILLLILQLSGWFLVPQVLRFGAFLFSSLCFLYTGLIIFNSKYTLGKAVFIIAFIVSSLNIIPILFFITQESKISQDLMSTLFISNAQEAKEYVDANFSLLHGLVLMLFVAFTFFLFFFNKPDNSKSISKSLVLLFLVAFMTSSLSGPTGALASEYMSYLYQKGKLEKLVEERANGLSKIHFDIKPGPNQASKVVIIIGESLNKSYMSLYGFNRSTTPGLENLVADSLSGNRLFVFNDVISPEVTTVPSLKKALTNSSNQNPIPFEKSVSLVDFFKKAGFESYWLSNQAPLGKFSTPISVISAAADSVYFSAINNKANDGAPLGTYYDEVLLAPFKNIVSKNTNSKQVYFIHLMGNHVNYEDRYPEQFNVFKEKEVNSENLYLNSIKYNDWVVVNLMKIAKESNVDVVCYFSDHGDELGYGHSTGNYKRGMSTIPFMVYLSKNYMDKNPELVKQLIKNKNTPAMTDNFFNDIQEITGTKSSVFDPKSSFISDQYIILKRKVIENSIPFDK